MIATPYNTTIIGQDLDHPEGLCIGPKGEIYAGGEIGQLYEILTNGEQRQIASTGGFLLGLALDGNEAIHACDMKRRAVLQIAPHGAVTERSIGTQARPMAAPNYPVFDANGNLYVSDSGEYWDSTGTGCIYVIRPDNTTVIFHEGPFRFANGLAIDPSQTWLYVVQSTASNVVRIPLDRSCGAVEVTHVLPPHTVPDGLAFALDGRLVITCYRPDIVYIGYSDGKVETLIEDLTAELLSRPTNAALYGGKLYIANLGGWHITAIDTDMTPAVIHRPYLNAVPLHPNPVL